MATTVTHRTRLDTPTYLELSTEPLSGLIISPAAEREATYQVALKLVARIDDDLTRGIRHYRDKAGVLLTTLDEVVRAILDNNLLLPDTSVLSEPVDLGWVPGIAA